MPLTYVSDDPGNDSGVATVGIVGPRPFLPQPIRWGEVKPEPDVVNANTFPLPRPTCLLNTRNRHPHALFWETMAKDYSQLWKNVTSARDEGKAVRTLAEILVDREGRTFIGTLKRADAELCIEVLDHVSLSLIRSIRFPLPRLRLPFH